MRQLWEDIESKKPNKGKMDGWAWRGSSDNTYTVKKTLVVALWRRFDWSKVFPNNMAPSKLFVGEYSIKQNSSKDNLLRRNIIQIVFSAQTN